MALMNCYLVFENITDFKRFENVCPDKILPTFYFTSNRIDI